ncbi:Sensory transduction histidine kinase [Methanosarcina barkeri str. Wiesmoor]|uniref:histidine kinase n=2 Tax=Methanosarcina barkeri TaxID=2208 RepID=A0A0E3QRE1_METBA|nr:response regulator [Methanosarcina barkeri]AKB52923.1 Sensory transduction histidine kinase [Methanosarcina barkeri str. Wiesmoor]
MNVSRKILAIIYIIFALLISVVIFASQSILGSTFSDLQEKEVTDNVEKVESMIELQILQLEKINSVLSSRDDVRNLMLNQDFQNLSSGTSLDDIFSISGCDFIFLVNNSGYIVYSDISDPEPSTNASALNASILNVSILNVSTLNASPLPKVRQRINDGSFLCKGAETSLKGLFMLKNDPAIISSQPVSAAPESKEISGTIILGKYLDSSFIESVQESTGSTFTLYSFNNASSDLLQAFFENPGPNFTYTVTGEHTTCYSVLEDLSGSPAIVIRADAGSNIYAEGQEALRYIVFFLLFAGLMIGASCKFLLDREVVSRIVAIDNFVEKVGMNENFSERYFMEGDDELSRLSKGINQTLDRLRTTSNEFKAQEHEKKLILDSLSELVVFMDSELKIIWLNKAALDHMGMKINDVIGRHYQDMYILYKENPGKSPVLKVLESGNEEFGEVVTQDGKIWTVTAIPIKNEDGRITGILKTGLDITAHRRSEEKLIQAKLEAEEANNSKSEFLANVSHELRTPLNSIIGFSDILIEKVFGELNEKQFRYVNNISTSGKHLLVLINDILDLSKVEAGKMELHYSEFSIDPVFEEVKAVLFPLIQAKPLEVTFNVEPDFTTLEADRGRLIQILYNLISNAIKFTPNGGKVSVYCKESGNRALISVIDTGIGISAEDQVKLFQPFTQLDASTSRQYCGTGLGLALVKKIVNLHQGDIWVESDPGKGSNFTFALPLRKPLERRKVSEIGIEDVTIEFEMNKAEALSVKENAENLQEEVKLPEICHSEKGDVKQELILVVDDDKSSSELHSTILKDAGYSVAILYSGKRVLEVAKNLKPDIITLDVFLPGTNGWLVLRQLKNDPYTTSIPVLIISMTNNNELGITLGATYSFAKPVNRIELVNSLREITGKFRFEYPKVLIVDDDENTVELLSSMIEPEGFETIKAYSGRECLQKLFFSEQQPDILILDLMMPEISGFDIISSMRADVHTKDIPLIVCTSGELTEKNLEELNSELERHLISILKKGTFGRKELINRIKQLAMLKRRNDEKNPDCRR